MLRRTGTLLLVFGTAILAITIAPGRAQNNATETTFKNPNELRLESTTRRRFRNYYRQHPGEQFGTEAFYPIGWSKDGKFAYFVEPVDEACGCYFAKLFILDLKVDKVLWSFDYDSEMIDDAKEAGKPYSFSTLWNANRKLFSDKLRENGIEPQTGFSPLSFPAASRGARLTASLAAKKKAGIDEDTRAFGEVERITLQLTSSRSGKKTVLVQDYPKAMPLYVGVVGYVRSPYEPRIAVVMMEIFRGYEGPPHTGHVKIAGAHLETGFK